MYPSVIYLTSFKTDMYEATGHRLISTFLESESDGRLLCCAEGFDLPPMTLPEPHKVYQKRIEDHPMLTKFLDVNKDVIPIHLGGEHQGCQCRGGPYDPHSKKHKQPCVGHWFNRNASRWFRKLVSMAVALEEKPDIIVWLGSDCVFLKKFPAKELVNIFKGKAVFYMQSPQRKVIEGDIMGFFLERGGDLFIQKTIERYQSGKFRQDPRWDDCYQCQMTRDLNKGISTIDIATHASGHSDVAKHSSAAPYLEHFKGAHGRGLGIMT